MQWQQQIQKTSFTISKRFKQPSSSLGQNLSLGSLEDDYHNVGCDDSQIFGRALSLLSWGTPCPPNVVVLDLTIDHTNLEHLVSNNTCSNLFFSFTHHLHHQHQQQQPQEQYLALESSIKCNLQVQGAWRLVKAIESQTTILQNNPISCSMLVGQPQVTFFHFSVGWGWMLQTPCWHFSNQTMSWKEFQVMECLRVLIKSQRPLVIWCTHRDCRCIIINTISMRCVLTCIYKHRQTL